MSQDVDPNQVLKSGSYRVLKVVIFICVCLAFYTLYMDAWVQKRMAGQKWDTPVQVFARPLSIYSHKFLPKQEVIDELKLLNYKSAPQPDSPGQFTIKQSFIEIYRRSYIGFDGLIAPQKIRIGFQQNRVAAVESFKDGQWLPQSITYLEPLLISRQATDSNEDREILDLSTIPEWMIDALLVVEDKNFYHHHGVAPLAIVRALFANISAGRKVQGGSTITQQLAKNLLLNDNRKSYFRKFKEAIIALILDYRYSKDAILEAYFNEIYLGQNGSRGVHGFALASKFYFNQRLADLTPEKFALLVAIVKGPSYYNPIRHKQRAQERRDLVLQLMVSDNVISKDDYQWYVNQPLALTVNKSKYRTRFPSYLQQVERELKTLDVVAPLNSGLMVFTGLDPLLQTRYERLFAQSIKQLESGYKQKDLNGAIVSISLENGTISALVGDKNNTAGGFNRALDSQRNIGSLVKPAVYLTALDEPDYHLGTLLPDEKISMQSNQGKRWEPTNYDKKLRGEVLLFDALSQSLNLPTVHLGMDVGLTSVISTLRKMGVDQQINKYPSLLLGALPMSPLQVAEVFQPIANFGQKFPVQAITHVTDNNGIKLLTSNLDSQIIFDYATSYELAYALTQVTKVGTAKRLANEHKGIQFGGKTGTTDDLRDSWFVGFDQNKVTSVWVGKDDNSPINLTGSQGALFVFSQLQQARIPESVNKPKPNNVELRYVEKSTGSILSGECGEHIQLPIRVDKITKIKDCPSLFDWL
ncbi:penicillin-binding protein 1B [Psychrosphaera aestuarii]|uniref:penicillin-binding protein 1B n=1 Tax=Psychrosphaera aestuarii TaxID=1266052 RepID=UPI001B32EC4F|nr:penicillin-binding protein 1B [Psychrosphaera aestuarii]